MQSSFCLPRFYQYQIHLSAMRFLRYTVLSSDMIHQFEYVVQAGYLGTVWAEYEHLSARIIISDLWHETVFTV